MAISDFLDISDYCKFLYYQKKLINILKKEKLNSVPMGILDILAIKYLDTKRGKNIDLDSLKETLNVEGTSTITFIVNNIANNYRGFGYKKTLEDFEDTMHSILSASIIVKKEQYEQKDELIENLKKKMMSHFRDITLDNKEVTERIKKDILNAENDFGISLTENIATNAITLMSKFRLSLHNLKESDTGCKYKDELDKLQKKNLNILTEKLKTLNNELPIQHKISIRDVFMNLKGREYLDISFVEELSTKIDKESILIIKDIEIAAVNVEKYSKEISEINKYERLSSIALNYFLAEKNLIETESKKINQKIKIEDVVSSFRDIFNKNQNSADEDKTKKNLLKKITNNLSNTKRLNNYIDRVHKRINIEDSKLNFTITKEEIEEAISHCGNMFKEYAEGNENQSILFKKMNAHIDEKIKNLDKSSSDKNYIDIDVVETISNTLKDGVYNKIIEEKYNKNKINKDAFNAYKIDTIKNLENDKYGFNKTKNEDILTCDNMQKVFKMIADKTLTSTEAQALIQNNKDILKGLNMSEKNAVEDLIEDISKIKKQEASLRKSNSPYKDYLFEDLKKKMKTITQE